MSDVSIGRAEFAGNSDPYAAAYDAVRVAYDAGQERVGNAIQVGLTNGILAKRTQRDAVQAGVNALTANELYDGDNVSAVRAANSLAELLPYLDARLGADSGTDSDKPLAIDRNAQRYEVWPYLEALMMVSRGTRRTVISDWNHRAFEVSPDTTRDELCTRAMSGKDFLTDEQRTARYAN